MDLERFKKSTPKQQPQKRSVNGDERIVNKGYQGGNSAVSSNTSETSFFDDEDKDIFGVWRKQDTIKQQRKAEEAAAKAAKKAAKQAKKLEKQRAKVRRTRTGERAKVGLSASAINGNRLSLPGYGQYKRIYIVAGLLLLLPIIGITVGAVSSSKDKRQPAGDGQVQGAEVVSAKPDFGTIKPTTIDNQATDIKYDGTKKVASFNDVIENVPITVSQQPLPSSFQEDPTAKVAELAKQINANDKISTSDVTAYSGISAKGPQTVVFTKNDLLIFIYADKKINTLTWSKYIESMRLK